MMEYQEGWIALFFLISCHLEEPSVPYGIDWEEKESAELLQMVQMGMKEIRRRGLHLSGPSS